MPLNVVVCGTPGTGKSTLIEKVRPKLEEFNFINVSKFAIEHKCIEQYDEELESHVIDEDKLLDKLEDTLKLGKQLNVIECIHGDLLSSDLVDLVFVCRTDNTKLYDRLKERGYNELKISNNLDSEIFQTILDEVLECFDEKNIIQLVNNDTDDLDKNARILIDKVRERLNVVVVPADKK